MLGNKIDNENYLSKTIFSDETSFHISGYVNRHNGRIWGEQLPDEVFDYVRDSPNVNVMCELVQDRVIKPFVQTSDYLDMLGIPDFHFFSQIINRDKGMFNHKH